MCKYMRFAYDVPFDQHIPVSKPNSVKCQQLKDNYIWLCNRNFREFFVDLHAIPLSHAPIHLLA